MTNNAKQWSDLPHRLPIGADMSGVKAREIRKLITEFRAKGYTVKMLDPKPIQED